MIIFGVTRRSLPQSFLLSFNLCSHAKFVHGSLRKGPMENNFLGLIIKYFRLSHDVVTSSGDKVDWLRVTL